MVDKIYIIHHPSLTERKLYLDEKIKEHNVNNIFWESEIYTSETFKDIKTNLSEKSVEVSYRHQKCLQDVINNQYKYGLIFEDDVELELFNNFPINDFLNICVEQMTAQAAPMCFVGMCAGLPGYPPVADFNPLVYHQPGFTTRCCHAYIVSNEGANILNSNFHYYKPVDHMYNEIINQRNVKSYYTKFGFQQGTVTGKYRSVIR